MTGKEIKMAEEVIEIAKVKAKLKEYRDGQLNVDFNEEVAIIPLKKGFLVLKLK